MMHLCISKIFIFIKLVKCFVMLKNNLYSLQSFLQVLSGLPPSKSCLNS